MSYDNDALEYLISCIIASWDQRNIGELVDAIFIAASMFKSSKWRNEVEYRFLIHERKDVIADHEFLKCRKSNGNSGAYLDMPIQNWTNSTEFPICAITFGAKSSHETVTTIRHLVKQKCLPIHPDFITRHDLSEEQLTQSSQPATGAPCG